MTRLRGRAPRGARLVDKTPHGHWKSTTFVAALRAAATRADVARRRRRGDGQSLGSQGRVRAAIEAVRARLVYLPPYSPDYNPIEQAFAKLKWLVRSAKPRTVDGLWSLLGRLLDRFSTTECRNYFRNSGYATTSGKTL